MLRPHLGSKLISAPLTFGVHCRTLLDEERCGRMIANPVKSTCTTTTPQISERAGVNACLHSLHGKIDPSKLAAGAVLRAKRLQYVDGGGRLHSVLSRWWDLQKPGSFGVLFVRWGFGASYRSKVRWRWASRLD